MQSAIRTLALIATLSLTACAPTHDGPRPAHQPPTGTGTRLNPDVATLDAGVTLLTPTISPREPVRVQYVLDNHGAPPWRIVFGTGCQITWVITAVDGRTFRPNHICTMATSYLEFGPDGLHTRELSIRTTREGQPDWSFERDELPPGRYRLEVYLYGYEGEMNTEAVWFVIVE